MRELVAPCLPHWISHCDSMQSFNVRFIIYMCLSTVTPQFSPRTLISLHSGLFKLTLIHRCTVKPGTLIWKSCSSFRRLSPLHWHCNSIQFRESLVLSKDRIEFHQRFRNQAAIKAVPKTDSPTHSHAWTIGEKKKRSNTRKWFYKHYSKQVTNETYGIVVLALWTPL